MPKQVLHEKSKTKNTSPAYQHKTQNMANVEVLAQDFLNALAEIEFRYITFFIGRDSRMMDDTFDKLKNHYWFAIEKGTPVFGFLYESDLPVEIRMRCLANYAHFFPEGYIYDNTF